MHVLKHTAVEVDNKLSKIPIPKNDTEQTWERTDAWTRIADQAYQPNSEYPQSGLAVAEAIESVEEKIPDDWSEVADQKYNSNSNKAQSGKAVAEAFANNLIAITDAEIIALFSK